MSGRAAPRSGWRQRVRAAVVVIGLFGGLALKGLGHLLAALGVPDAGRLVGVAHVLITVSALVIVGRMALRALERQRRRRRARQAVEQALRESEPVTDITGALELTAPALVDSGLVPGVVAGAITGAQTVGRGYGVARPERGDPPHDHTRFEIGSLTKTFTGILLAGMVERGEIALEDPLARFLPALQSPDARAITLLDLATHRSGLPRLPPGLYRTLIGRALLQQDPTDDPYADVTFEQLERGLDRARLRPRGSRFAYSNFGYAVLGGVLARVAGAPYEQLVVERVCRPLGLEETGFQPPEELGARLAQGHDRLGKPAAAWHTAAIAPAGGLRSTLGDMIRYAEAQLHPHRTGLATSLVRAQRPLRPTDDGLGTQIGLAWLTRPGKTGDVLWHNGGTTGFSAFVGVLPGQEVAAVLLGNAGHDPLFDRVGLHLLEVLAASPAAVLVPG